MCGQSNDEKWNVPNVIIEKPSKMVKAETENKNTSVKIVLTLFK